MANQALLPQINIGWYNTLCGFLSPSLIDLQSSHYKSISSTRSATRWATLLITSLWDIVHQLWNHRNDIIHSNNNIQLLSGINTLKDSIREEHARGDTQLPSVYSSYFHLPLSSLLSKNCTYLKRWFLVIRSARESYTNVSYNDPFSLNGHLRTWIGLKPLP